MKATTAERNRVLVVEDDEHVRGFCLRVLESIGLTVETASSAKEAWRRMLGGRFDFVLTDIQMSDSHAGVTLAEEIRHRWPETDIVMMTGHPALETAIPSLKTGVFDYLIKPFPRQQLEAVARRLLGLRRVSRQLEREKFLRAELEAAYFELQKVERLKAALIARVSHELRTPVTIARMAAGLLDEEITNPASKTVLAKLSSAIDSMQGVVEDLILFAQSKTESFRLNKTETDLHALLERIIETHRPLWERRGLGVTLSSKGERKPFLADGGLLTAAFTRLMLNAINFNEKGGRIELSVDYGSNEIAVAFLDTGVGVARDEREKIFDGLYQAAEHMTREVGGLGVGLAVSRRIVEAHGGVISVESHPGEGSVFTLRFPEEKRAPDLAVGAVADGGKTYET